MLRGSRCKGGENKTNAGVKKKKIRSKKSKKGRKLEVGHNLSTFRRKKGKGKNIRHCKKNLMERGGKGMGNGWGTKKENKMVNSCFVTSSGIRQANGLEEKLAIAQEKNGTEHYIQWKKPNRRQISTGDRELIGIFIQLGGGRQKLHRTGGGTEGGGGRKKRQRNLKTEKKFSKKGSRANAKRPKGGDS